MFHFYGAITNKKGDALPGYYAQLADPSGNVAPIYSDNNATPIVNSSGVANMALVDPNGMASFYVNPASYTLNIYGSDAATLYDTFLDVPCGLNTITLASGSSVSTRSALAAISLPVNGQTALVSEPGREGLFVFDSANHSSDVTGDPGQWNFVPPSSDTTGASGSWVRKSRAKLSGNRTLYVRADGSDSHDGSSNISSAAMLTIQHAINVAYQIFDCNGYTITIQCAAGTYTAPIAITGPLVNGATATPLIILGDEVTPSNVVISTSTDAIKVTHGGYLCLKGIRTTTSAGDAWTAETFGLIEHQNCEHGNVSGICFASHYNGQIKQIAGTYRCAGDADSFVHITTRSMVRFTGEDWGFSKPGGCSFTTYLFGINDSTCDADGSTLSGSVIAGRTTVHLNASLNLAVASRSGYTSSILGPGPWILGGDSNINLTEWTSLHIYIDPAGSDNNTGIGPESYNAFKTISGALAALKTIPFSYDRTNASNNFLLLNLANGTYAESVVAVDLPCWTSVKIVGTNGASNVTLAGVSDGFYASGTKSTKYTLSAMTITATAAGNSAIRADNGAIVKHDTVTFGACGSSHKRVDTGGKILNVGSTEKLSGGAQHHALVQGGGLVDLATVACTTTVTGTPAFSGPFAFASDTSLIRATASLLTYSGSATGSYYSASTNAVIDTSGGGATFFPGSSAGSTATGGQYV